MRISGAMPPATDPILRETQDPGVSDALAPANARRERLLVEKNEYGAMDGMLSGLEEAAREVGKGFRALTLTSSHPEILRGEVTGLALEGQYEIEVRQLAKSHKLLAEGFPDTDRTPVGFGFMTLESLSGERPPIDVVIEPGSTLRDVAEQINAASDDLRATIINTGMKDDPFRLLVVSKESGEPFRIALDEDTTFLSTRVLTEGRDLDALFEGVYVKGNGNSLNELLPGVSLKAQRAEPGTRVELAVTRDVDKTLDSVKSFVESYNTIALKANDVFSPDAANADSAARGALREVMRNLQPAASTGAGTRSLAEVGITTDAKTGALRIDEGKLKEALAKDHDGVHALFTGTPDAPGLATRISEVTRRLRDPVHGVLKTRLKGIDERLRLQDEQIERQTRRLEERKAALERQMALMQERLQGLESEQAMLGARFGGQSGGGGDASSV